MPGNHKRTGLVLHRGELEGSNCLCLNLTKHCYAFLSHGPCPSTSIRRPFGGHFFGFTKSCWFCSSLCHSSAWHSSTALKGRVWMGSGNMGARILSGFAAMFVLEAIHLLFYIRAAPSIYFILIISLVLVIILGDFAKGGLILGLLNSNPRNFSKLAMQLYLSVILCRDEPHPCNVQRTMLASMYVSITVVLVASSQT